MGIPIWQSDDSIPLPPTPPPCRNSNIVNNILQMIYHLPPSRAKLFFDLLFSQMTLISKEAVVEILWANLTPLERQSIRMPSTNLPNMTNAAQIQRDLAATFTSPEEDESSSSPGLGGYPTLSNNTGTRISIIAGNRARNVRRMMMEDDPEREPSLFIRRPFRRGTELIATRILNQQADTPQPIQDGISSGTSLRDTAMNLEDHILQVLIDALQRSTTNEGTTLQNPNTETSSRSRSETVENSIDN